MTRYGQIALTILGIKENITQLNIVFPALDGNQSAEAELITKHNATIEKRRIILGNINNNKNG
jgi:hypothetical protein